MSKIGQEEGAAVGIAPAAVLGSALLKGAGIWMRGNGEILSALKALMAGCMGVGARHSISGLGLSKRCVSVEAPSISFECNKIGYATPFG
jgi:hypothetical protein